MLSLKRMRKRCPALIESPPVGRLKPATKDWKLTTRWPIPDCRGLLKQRLLKLRFFEAAIDQPVDS